MEKTVIEKIGNKISKKYGMPKVIVTRKRNGEHGYMGYEIRTELPSYEGGSELQESIYQYYAKKFISVIVENLGGCIYFAYTP